MHWSIGAALNSDLFDRVIVSTDDQEIAESALKAGAEVPFLRPADIADDRATLREVIRHTVTAVEQNGPRVTALCNVYATACFLKPQDLHLGWQALQEDGAQYSFAAASYAHPIQRAFSIGTRGEVIVANPDSMATRTQDLIEHYFDAGMFFWGWRDSFFSDVRIYSDVGRVVKIPAVRVHDIDTPEDWDRAELAWQTMRAKPK